MIIQFGSCLDPTNKVNKTFTLAKSVAGKLVDDFSTLDPVIVVRDFDKSWNYCYIESIGKYYFIESCAHTANNLARVSLHEDVLNTFSSQLDNNITFYNAHAKSNVPFNDVFAKSNNLLVTIKSV